MNKTTVILLLLLTLILTACGASASNAAGPASGLPGGASAGELSAPMQIAIGTIKLDETDSAVTTEQAKELLPLWQTLQVLYESDTAATQEIDALLTQIQETMTDEQTQAITALNLTRQDMMSLMQTQGPAMDAASGNAQSGNSTSNSGDGFGLAGGGFQGPPPDERGMPGGNLNFQGPGSSSTDNSTNSNRPTTIDPNRIPTPLVQAVIDYLKKKAGS